MLVSFLIAIFATCTYSVALPRSVRPNDQPYAHVTKFQKRSNPADSLTVDLGYDIYRGVVNKTSGFNSWKGIRFAAPPTGTNRWQMPLIPPSNRSDVILADQYSAQCPQSSDSNGVAVETGITGDEDCLFLNVWSPATSNGSMPVMVWIHGGGYGQFNGREHLTTLIEANGNSFVGVSIQYRLGAFGFLSSQEVFSNGIVNAGIQDQFLALQWVQQYIGLFGGDPSRVTIAGESAGGGSVMLLDIAHGGSLGNELFQNSIAASPYLPMQYAYNAEVPTASYNAFVEAVGCSSYSGSNFDCLVAASTETLQNANSYVNTAGLFGTWAFLPVTDGSLIQDLPSRQLAAGKVNGQHMLTGNNAIEGSGFVPNNLTTEADVTAWLSRTFPMLSDSNVNAILSQYPIQDVSITASSPRFATDGLSNPNANEVSPEGAGQNQRAYNIYSETTFVCPSYWLAEAYTNAGSNGSSAAGYKYQYSVIPSTHGQDTYAYFLPPQIPHSADFSLAFKRILGNFVTTNNPSISNELANGQSTGNDTPNPASTWPSFNQQSWPMINLNETFTSTTVIQGQVYPATGIMNDITLVNAYTWEAGRGSRCEFWRSLGAQVPEK